MCDKHSFRGIIDAEEGIINGEVIPNVDDKIIDAEEVTIADHFRTLRRRTNESSIAS